MFNQPMYYYYLQYDTHKYAADTDIGIMTPQYMYEHSKWKQLDPILDGWRRRIINVWEMYSYADPKSLSREEIIDALNIRMGPDYMMSIPLFHFIPGPALGWQSTLVMRYMNIYRIDINQIELKKWCNNDTIDWGKDARLRLPMNRLLCEKERYADYVKYYRDNAIVDDKIRLLDQLNQIHLNIGSDFIPMKFVTNMTNEMGMKDMYLGGDPTHG